MLLTVPAIAQLTTTVLSENTIEDYLEAQIVGLQAVNVTLSDALVAFSGVYDDDAFITLQGELYRDVDNKLQIRLQQTRLNQQDLPASTAQAIEATLNQALYAAQSGLQVRSLSIQSDMVLLEIDPPPGTLDDVSIQRQLMQVIEDDFALVNDVPFPQSRSLLNAADQALLDRAVDTALSADSLRLAVSASLLVEGMDESARIRLSGTARFADLSSIQSLKFDSDIVYTYELNNDIVWRVRVEQRILDGMLYGRGTNLQNGQETRWFGVPLSGILDDIFVTIERATGIEPFDNLSETPPEPPADVADLLILTNYITTERTDTGTQPTARYTTTFDLEGMIDSADTLGVILEVLGRTGLNLEDWIGDDDIETAASTIAFTRRFFVPELEFTIDRFVNPTTETFERIEGQFLTELNLMDEIRVRGDFRLIPSGYNDSFEIVAPDDFVAADSLEQLDPEDVLIEPEN